jgi:hypothetical protein
VPPLVAPGGTSHRGCEGVRLWERNGSGGLPSGAVKRGLPGRTWVADLPIRPRAGSSYPRAPCSGRRGRRFKSGHPDQKFQVDGMMAKRGDHAIDHLLAIRWRDRTSVPGMRRGGSPRNITASGHRPSRVERVPGEASNRASPGVTVMLSRSGHAEYSHSPGSTVGGCSHNPEVAGSNPAPATSKCRSGA